ncbi:hypothetical protein PENTCL1PPCAC_3298, partial [Pristionchus entomophagus]
TPETPWRPEEPDSHEPSSEISENGEKFLKCANRKPPPYGKQCRLYVEYINSIGLVDDGTIWNWKMVVK